MQPLLIKHATIHDLETDNLGAFFKDAHRRGWHRTGQDTSNIRVVPARGSEKDDLVGVRVKDGRDERNVWEMSVTRVGKQLKGRTMWSTHDPPA